MSFHLALTTGIYNLIDPLGAAHKNVLHRICLDRACVVRRIMVKRRVRTFLRVRCFCAHRALGTNLDFTLHRAVYIVNGYSNAKHNFALVFESQE